SWAVRYCLLMDVIALTRQLVDIESITGNEAAVGEAIYRELCRLGYQVKTTPVEGDRFNVFACHPEHPHPAAVFSTHMDTVPPFIPSSEDALRVYGRGSCDAKGIIAIQIAAAERLRREGIHVGLLFLVGEERDSQGAKTANEHPMGSRFLIKGERAPNVIPDHAKAHLLYRLVGPTEELRRQIVETVGDLAHVDFYLEIPFVRLRAVDGWPTMVAAFTTDIPALTNWGEPLLVGPGSIHVAHTDGEYVEKKQLSEAVELYYGLTKKLLSAG